MVRAGKGEKPTRRWRDRRRSCNHKGHRQEKTGWNLELPDGKKVITTVEKSVKAFDTLKNSDSVLARKKDD
ncbi:MAG: hypothetical protein JSV01_00065 [Desulfobacterales bacterium]|nr:MAG: hypothetical protein JSV01_00065 [Desulfobacterales bacterium]